MSREEEKQASRDRDAEMLRKGEITPQELRIRNHLLGGMDLSSFRIVSIGGRNVGQ